MRKHANRKICLPHKVAKAAGLFILVISLSIVPFAFATSESCDLNIPSSSDESTGSLVENPEENGTESNQDATDGSDGGADKPSPDKNYEAGGDTGEGSHDKDDESGKDDDELTPGKDDESDKDDDELTPGKDDESDDDDTKFDGKHHWYVSKFTEPTCTTAGLKIWRCFFHHNQLMQETIPAPGHDLICEFIWADDYSSATVEITCARCDFKSTGNGSISSTTNTDEENKPTTTTYTAEYTYTYSIGDNQITNTFTDKQVTTASGGSEGGDNGDDKTDEGDQTGGEGGGNGGGTEGGGEGGGDGDDKTDKGDQTGDEGGNGDKTDEGGNQSDDAGSSSNDYYVPEPPAVQPSFTGSVAIESPIKGFTAHIEGAPAGKIAMAVNQVSSGPAFEALMNTITARFSSVNGQTFDIAGVFDVNLSIENKNMTEEFGTLTLEFPINSKFNGRTAYIFHSHGAPGNITSFTPVTVTNGKVIVGGITQLSTFAVAIADNPLEIPVGTVVQLPTSSAQTTAIPQEAKGSGIRHIEPISDGSIVPGLSSHESALTKESPIWRTYDSGMSVMIVRLILISIACAAIITMIILAQREKRTDKI